MATRRKEQQNIHGAVAVADLVAAEKRQRLLVLTGFIALAGALLLFIAALQLDMRMERLTFFAAEAFLFFIGLGSLTFWYLRGSEKRFSEAPLGDATGDRLASEITGLRASLLDLENQIAKAAAQSGGHDQTISANGLTPEELAKQRAEEVAMKALRELRTTFDNAYSRLREALEDINRRGNVNLAIGVATTGLGAVSLGYMVFYSPEATDLTTILTHYLPRLSTVVFIEVFAFFFLRLYRTTLAETKYYQTELLNLASLDIAHQAVLRSPDPAVMGALMSQLSRYRMASSTSTSAVDEVDTKGIAELVKQILTFALEARK